MTQKFNVTEFLERLSKARADGRAKLEIDFNRVTHPNSPLPFESFKGKIAYIYLGLIAVFLAVARLGLGVSWRDAAIALAVLTFVYWVVARRLLERWATHKIIDQLLSDSDGWEKMWRFGGITLTVADPIAPGVWVAPKGDWKEAFPKL